MTKEKKNSKKQATKQAAGIEKRPRNKEKKVNFQFAAESGVCVCLAGSFNDWKPEQHQLKGEKGVFSTTLKLPVGKHEYRFVVDGVWQADPQCKEWTPNGFGSINSVISVE